jgi:hypothetical protein
MARKDGKPDGRRFNGGKREGAGRPYGAVGPYHKTALQKLRALAQQYSEEALLRIVTVMRTSNNPMAQLAAAGMILDRGHGKAREYVTVDQNETLTIEYETVEQARAKLIADGYPLDHLQQPKLIEHSGDDT